MSTTLDDYSNSDPIKHTLQKPEKIYINDLVVKASVTLKSTHIPSITQVKEESILTDFYKFTYENFRDDFNSFLEKENLSYEREQVYSVIIFPVVLIVPYISSNISHNIDHLNFKCKIAFCIPNDLRYLTEIYGVHLCISL